MRSIANNHRACTALALGIATIVVLLLSPVPIARKHLGDVIAVDGHR